MMKKSYPFFFVLMFVASVFAQSPNIEKKIYVAKPINPHPPVIDGRLNDPVWEKVEWQGDFTQREPDDGAKPSQETAFKVLFDDRNLYVGIRAYDTEPDKIVKRVTRRDRFDGDWVEINIDSYFDHRTAFSFTVSAAGVKGDEAISNDGDNWDGDWNSIWFAGVASDDQGWTAEMRIPFNQLRFSNQEEQIWGLQIQRRLYREQERSVWQYIPRNSGGWVSYFGELHGIKGVKAPRRIEVLPYTVSDHRRLPKEAGNPFITGKETNFSGGADVKLGVTSDLTLDVTINPDFGQVEADPSEVNLTAFESFFSEKRPFFIEGKNILDYRLATGDGSSSNDRLFYSRRIGRRPQFDPELGSDEFADVPDNSSILTAMKLTGKTKSGLSIGVLEAVTARERADIDLGGQRRQETAEPLTNYFLGRLQKDYRDGNSSIGGVFTATNRDLDQPHLQFLNRAAYSGGLDFRHEWNDKTYYVDVRSAFSHIRGHQEAILRAQTASARYYQRPDADHVTLDSSRTSLTGHGGMISVGRGGSHRLRTNFGVLWRSPGLELNDLGFMRQADRVMQWSWAGYSWTKPFSIFRSLRLNFNQWAGWNFGGESMFVGGNINGGGQLKNFWSIWGGINREGNNLSTSALRGGPAMKFPATWNNWYNIHSDGRKALQVSVGGFNSWSDAGGSRTNNVWGSVRFRPQDALQIRINPSYNFRKRDLQYISTQTHNGDDRYIFGQINQKTLGVSIRVDYSITPDLSIQYYGQPFVSAGTYSRFKRITLPRAEKYHDRFHVFSGDEVRFDSGLAEYEFDEDLNGATDYTIEKPDFNFRQFRSNLVVRWEYNPGSAIFLVWTQERTGSDDHGRFSFRGELDNLFEDDSSNVFLVKVSRWFSL